MYYKCAWIIPRQQFCLLFGVVRTRFSTYLLTGRVYHLSQLSFRNCHFAEGTRQERGLFASLQSSFSCPSLETFSDSCVSENVMVHSRFQWVLGDSRLIPTVYFIVRRVHLFPLDTFVEFHNVSYNVYTCPLYNMIVHVHCTYSVNTDCYTSDTDSEPIKSIKSIFWLGS